jgi:hydroxyacylglutathione hydrolase
MSKTGMTVWGVGPRFTLLSLLYFILTLAIHYVCYPAFVIQAVPYAALVVVGVFLLATGLPVWAMASQSVDRAFEEGVLATQGAYALCRHPIYGNAIFFTIPGLLLFFRSWLMLSMPVAMYVVFKLLIREEEAHLRQKFGPAYLEYESKVNEVFPKVWQAYSQLWYPTPTGRVDKKVYAIRDKDVAMFCYVDGEHAIAIDAAYAEDTLGEAFRHIPVEPGSVTHVFLTHTDVDHAGGLGLFPNAHVHLSKDEVQMVDGSTPRFLWIYHNPKIARPYTALADGQIVTVGTIKVQAIATPGHTPGSMSYLVNDRVLFTGDTLILQDGFAGTFYRLFNMDTAAQRASIQKLARLRDVAVLCTAHTGCTTAYVRAIKHWRTGETG